MKMKVSQRLTELVDQADQIKQEKQIDVFNTVNQDDEKPLDIAVRMNDPIATRVLALKNLLTWIEQTLR